MKPTAAAFAIAAVTTTASTQPVDFTIETQSSNAAGTLGLLANSQGTLIGDFDQDTNPQGTQTRPGLFGGSGNNPIPVTIDIGTNTSINTGPAGTFSLDADTEGLTIEISDLAIDLLNGNPVESSIDLSLLFDTFRTLNPTGFYPGGIPLPLTFPAGQISSLTIQQEAPGIPGALIPGEDGSFQFAAAVPVTLTLLGTTIAGAPLEPAPIPVLLPLTGIYSNSDTPEVSINISLDVFSQTVDTTALPPLPEIPFNLPTLGGENASVLINIAISALTLEGAGTVNLNANASPLGCNPADIAHPLGVLDLADISAFIEAFTTAQPAADLDNNGIYDLTDLQLFITAFVTGCP